MSNRSWQYLILFVLFALTRLIWFQLEGDLFLNKFPHQDDVPTYLQIANIFRGEGSYAEYGISPYSRTPLWPLTLAATQQLFGAANLVAAFIILNLMQLVVILLLFRFLLTRQSPLVAFGTAAALTLFLDFALYAFLLRSETLFTLLLFLATLSLLKALRQSTPPYLVLTGVLFGLATLTRPISALAIIPATLLIFFYQQKELPRAARASAIIFGAFILTLSPWLIRNYRLTDSILLQQDTGNIYFATLPGGHYNSVKVVTIIPNTADLTELEIDRQLTQQALLRIRSNPSTWLTNSLHNFFYRLWATGYIDTHLRYFEHIPDSGGYHQTASASPFARLAQSLNIFSDRIAISAPYHLYLIANNILGFSFIAFSLLGLALVPFLPPPERAVFLIVLTLWAGTSLFSFSGSRYMIPLVPLLLIVIAAYPAAVQKALRQRHPAHRMVRFTA